MFRWLNGPGAVFRHPLPKSTNYLNAYDASGNLLRAGTDASLEKGKRKEKEKEDEEVEVGEDDDMTSRSREKAKRSDSGRGKTEPGLPRETAEDLMPFPLNRQFRSQSVLSEELKDAIYRQVAVEGRSVSNVSALLGVEMRRVGAVVRLKAVEKQWEEEVSTRATLASTFNHFAMFNDEPKQIFD